jgi:hypothetical protein
MYVTAKRQPQTSWESIIYMRVLFNTLSSCLVLVLVSGASSAPVCPCKDPKLCLPIQRQVTKESFLFSNVVENAPQWDWTRITTLAIRYELDPGVWGSIMADSRCE